MIRERAKDAGATEGVRRAAGGNRGTGGHAQSLWQARRKMGEVLELPRGEDEERLGREHAVTAATLSDWRDAVVASGEDGPRICEDHRADEQGGA